MQPLAERFPQLVRALYQRFGVHWRAENVAGTGYSRFEVFALFTDQGRFALKQHAKEQRDAVLSQHAFQQRLASDPACRVPLLQRWVDGATWMDDNHHGWELCTWVTGEPWPSDVPLSEQAWRQQLDAIIAMHRNALRWRVSEWGATATSSLSSLPRGWSERRERLRFWSESQIDWSFMARGIVDANRADSRLVEALARVRRWMPELTYELEQLCRSSAPSWWIVRDMWRAHWLFDRGKLMGLIDFGAARLDWPGLDLIRAWGTMLDENDPRWQSGCEHYCCEVPEAQLDARMLRIVHRVSVTLSLLQWCEWCMSGSVGSSSGLSPRFAELIQRILTMAES